MGGNEIRCSSCGVLLRNLTTDTAWGSLGEEVHALFLCGECAKPGKSHTLPLDNLSGGESEETTGELSDVLKGPSVGEPCGKVEYVDGKKLARCITCRLSGRVEHRDADSDAWVKFPCQLFGYPPSGYRVDYCSRYESWTGEEPVRYASDHMIPPTGGSRAFPPATAKRVPSSWFAGTCKQCGYNVVVTQPDAQEFPYMDYWWYCSNKKCKHHTRGEHTVDMEHPDWVGLED